MSTPVQRQYAELKKQNPDAILFFRLGDFYEMFYEDAVLASRILGIALTARHRGTENEMPMCGFPHHAHEEYLEKLIENDYKVAIAEQIEDIETKSITRRIVRVVTPGTTLEQGNLSPERNTFLAAVSFVPQKKSTSAKAEYGIAYSDLSTGEFRTCLFENEISFLDELYKLNPSEILLPQRVLEDEGFCRKLPRSHHTPRPALSEKNAVEILQSHFGISNIEVFGLEKIALLIEVSAQVLQYLQETQKSNLSHISKLIRYSSGEVMQLDRQTFRHLEVFESLQRGEGSTLWSVFEKSATSMGARMLHRWLLNPLLNVSLIQERQEGVAEIFGSTGLQKVLKENLQKISDLERILARLVTGRGNARDLAFLRDSFSAFPSLGIACQKASSPLLQTLAKSLQAFDGLFQKLESQLVEHPPVEITGGGIFLSGVSERLDELRELSHNAQKWLDNFLEEKKKESGISTLKVKFSQNFGFCLEVSNGQKDHVPASWVRRQTLVNAERYTTPELAEYEQKVLSAEGESFALEHEMFVALREYTLKYTYQIQEASRAVATLDGLFTLACTAHRWRWTKPNCSNSHKTLRVIGGRHPVVERISIETFIANDLVMDEDSRFHLITGPNMAGKSTFLRQNALIILLAQIGSFVPAREVRMGIFDRIFTRVGASDNLSGGQSTFFVEMTETARILHAATDKSFIILDEIGRGTSTFDGISLAWAITEFLHDEVKAKTLFATHYHELIDLAEDLSAARNYHVEVSQNKNGIVFLRHIAEGGISDSFGIEVAGSAGIPTVVLKNAKEVLKRLESENLLSGKPTLFSAVRVREKIVEPKSELEDFFVNVNENELTPKEALDLVFRMKEIFKKKS